LPPPAWTRQPTTGTIALAGPGYMALVGPGPEDISRAATIVIACILGCAATCILSAYRFTLVTLTLCFFGPMLAGFYVAGLSFVSRVGAAAGWVLMAVALLPLATMLAAPAHIEIRKMRAARSAPISPWPALCFSSHHAAAFTPRVLRSCGSPRRPFPDSPSPPSVGQASPRRVRRASQSRVDSLQSLRRPRAAQ
jgi:hypothetical protein